MRKKSHRGQNGGDGPARRDALLSARWVALLSARRDALLSVRRRVLLSARRIALLSVLAGCLLTALTGCSVAARVRYDLSGAGVEHWEEAALEAGAVSEVEEYYYDHIPEELHEAYREMYVHIMRGEDAGDFLARISGDDFWRAYYAVLADHPEIFWIGASAQIESDITGRVVAYDLETAIPAEARPSMREKLEAAADECIAGIPEGASEYEKIKYVYEYLINTVEYRAGSADSQNIQSALLYRASVCAGYSRAFQYILHRMGLFCTYITGRTTNGGDHGWNMVRIGDLYYYVDVTWGDPVFAGQVDGTGGADMINYNYLCCTDEDLFRTHVPDDSVELPPCTDDSYNYYRRNNCYYENFDYDVIHDALMNSVWNGEPGVVMKFGNRDAYDTAVYELFEDHLLDDPGNYLMEINGVSTWNYRYHTDEGFLLITIYW